MRYARAGLVLGLVALGASACGGGAAGEGSLASFQLDGAATGTAGAPYQLVVTAIGGTGRTLASYDGTVTFESDDARAQLPGPYTFTAADQGVHTFTLTLATAGRQTVRVAEASKHGAKFVTVAPAAPASLIAVSGDGQGAPAGKPLTHPLVVKALDAFENPVPGVAVTWAAEGAGSVSGAATTGDDGTASASATLGGLGSQEYSARAATFEVTFEAFGMQGEVHALALVSGNGQTGAAGLALAQPLVVKATDELGSPYPGVTVSWAATQGGGSFPAATVTTGPDGLAAVAPLLGQVVGANQFTATAAPLPAITFDATGVAGAAATLVAVSGDAQIGAGTLALAQPLVVAVTDAFGNPVAGSAVGWSVGSGAGAIAASAPTTDAAGRASATATLGPSEVAHSFSAAAPGLAGSPITFTASRNTYQLVYTDPASGAGKLRLQHNAAASTATWLVLDVVVGAQPLHGYSTGMNLPIDTARATLDPATPLVLPASTTGTLDPGAAPQAVAISLPTSGPLAGQIVVGLSQKAEGAGAVTTDTVLAPGTVLYSLRLELVPSGAPGVVFDGTGTAAAITSGGLLDKAGNVVVGRTEVAIGRLAVGL